jgi:hypothetical protein
MCSGSTLKPIETAAQFRRQSVRSGRPAASGGAEVDDPGASRPFAARRPSRMACVPPGSDDLTAGTGV